LSSQETDAHHRETHIPHPGLISLFLFDHHCGDLCKLPEMIFPVKSAVPIKSGRSSLYALPGSHYLLAPPGGALPSLPVPGSAPVRARRFHGDVLLAAPRPQRPRRAHLVASVRRSGARIAPRRPPLPMGPGLVRRSHGPFERRNLILSEGSDTRSSRPPSRRWPRSMIALARVVGAQRTWRAQNRCVVAPNGSPFLCANTRVGVTENTSHGQSSEPPL
jgi:hypothetical protein